MFEFGVFYLRDKKYGTKPILYLNFFFIQIYEMLYIYLYVFDSRYSCKIIKKDRNYCLILLYLNYVLQKMQLVFNDKIKF
jgi:hypothetical protein